MIRASRDPWHMTELTGAAYHGCAVTAGLRVRTASGMVGAVGEWMDPRSGCVGVTTDDGEYVIASDVRLS